MRFVSTICFVLLSISSFAQPSFVKDSLDTYIQEGLKDWNIPGLAIVIVKDGKIVLKKGYGVRNIETQQPVTENTLFMIASNSKLFTGTALAQLAYNKKLSLNDKITKHFPSYKLYDKNVEALVTIKDMLGHKLGTKTFQGDFTFWNSNFTRGEIMAKMQFMQPSANFRQDFGYCNSCYLTAGEIIPKVTGIPWEVYVFDSIVQPLGMNNTSVLSYNMEKMPESATPYTTSFSSSINKLPYDNIDNIAPAGSIVSNVNDVSKWLLMQLDSGKYNGKQILPWQVIRATRDANTLLSTRKNGATHYTAYGLGVFMNDYAGKQVYWHTGGAFGFVTNTCFIPEEKLGIAILTNQDNQDFFELLRMQIINAYLNQPYVNLSKQTLPTHKEEIKKTSEKLNAFNKRVKNNTPTLPLESYMGRYANTLYGPIEINKTTDGKNLEIKFKQHTNLKALLQYMDNDEWLLTYNNIGFGVFATKFILENKIVKEVNIKVNDFIEYDVYTFIKQ